MASVAAPVRLSSPRLTVLIMPVKTADASLSPNARRTVRPFCIIVGASTSGHGKKLNILSATLVGLCVLTGSVVYSLVRSHHGFGDLSCEANATFNYFNSLDAQAAHDDIQLSLKINYIFLSGDKGVMMLSGLANDGEEKYFVNRRVNFSYVSQGSFYRFHYGEVNYSPRDTLPDEVYTYFFSTESTFYHIRSVDKNTLMFSDAYSPMFLCNIES